MARVSVNAAGESNDRARPSVSVNAAGESNDKACKQKRQPGENPTAARTSTRPTT